MTLFRNAVLIRSRLDGERESQTPSSSRSQKPRKETGPSKTAHRRYTFRNYLRLRLRQRLEGVNKQRLEFDVKMISRFVVAVIFSAMVAGNSNAQQMDGNKTKQITAAAPGT